MALHFLARQMFRLRAPAQEDWIWKMRPFIDPIPRYVLADMQAGKRIDLTNDGGDVLEAVGGIVHPWASESKMLVNFCFRRVGVREARRRRFTVQSCYGRASREGVALLLLHREFKRLRCMRSRDCGLRGFLHYCFWDEASEISGEGAGC